jgi:hypothetical protein
MRGVNHIFITRACRIWPHGHHHPEEHDWGQDGAAGKAKEPARADQGARPVKRSATGRAKRRSK